MILIHSGALGDFLLALHMVARVRDRGEPVDFLGRGEHGLLGCEGGFLRRRWNVEHSGFHQLYADAKISDELGGILKSHEVVLLSTAHPERNVMVEAISMISGARVFSFDPRADARARAHITHQWERQLTAAGMPSELGVARLKVPDRKIEEAESRAGWRETSMRVVIQPGSGGRRKNWPLDHFIAVAARLQQAEDTDVCFLMGPVEAEMWSGKELGRLRSVGSCIGGLSLEESAAFISGADLFIGNDSGMSHLAAAMGRPVLAIFGATRPEIWRPLGEQVYVLGDEGVWPAIDEVCLKALELSAIVRT